LDRAIFAVDVLSAKTQLPGWNDLFQKSRHLPLSMEASMGSFAPPLTSLSVSLGV